MRNFWTQPPQLGCRACGVLRAEKAGIQSVSSNNAWLSRCAGGIVISQKILGGSLLTRHRRDFNARLDHHKLPKCFIGVSYLREGHACGTLLCNWGGELKNTLDPASNSPPFMKKMRDCQWFQCFPKNKSDWQNSNINNYNSILHIFETQCGITSAVVKVNWQTIVVTAPRVGRVEVSRRPAMPR